MSRSFGVLRLEPALFQPIASAFLVAAKLPEEYDFPDEQTGEYGIPPG